MIKISTLSLCMIVKNEEKNIARCLKSVESIVDEMIIVDTGSSDNTISIAESFGAKIINHPWNNNFSEARNISFDNATMNWIIYLDADEEVDPLNVHKIKSTIVDDSKEAYCLQLTNIINGKETLTCTSLRLIKNKPEYRFEGRIHEQLLPSINRYYGNEFVGITYIKLFHYGYDEKVMNIPLKIKRNLSIFESYPESEKDGFYYYNYANELLRIDEKEKAAESYIKSITTPGFDNGYTVFLAIYTVKVLHDLKRYEEAIHYANVFLKQYPNFKDLHFLKGACYYDTGRFSEAKKSIEKFSAINNEGCNYPTFHLEDSNDIYALLRELSEKSITRSKKLLTVCVLAEEPSTTIEDICKTLKSVNEIGDEIIVFHNGLEESSIKTVKEYGAKSFHSKSSSIKFLDIIKRSKLDWILMLNPGEILSNEHNKSIISHIESQNSRKIMGYRLNVEDTLTKLSSHSLRLFKPNKKFNSINDFEISFAKSNKIMDANITISK